MPGGPLNLEHSGRLGLSIQLNHNSMESRHRCELRALVQLDHNSMESRHRYELRASSSA